jgi:hypothetical protein
MTRKPIEELRTRIESEIREKSNKPRFCYMGYTPPLCIGDSMLKAEGPKEPPAHKEAMKVPYPKQGSLFSTSQPLCVGDFFPGSYIVRKPADNGESKKIPSNLEAVFPTNCLAGLSILLSLYLS